VLAFEGKMDVTLIIQRIAQFRIWASGELVRADQFFDLHKLFGSGTAQAVR
jgi:hypothetical protein